MKSVCPMVCQKNENVLYTPCKPLNKPCTHPRQTTNKPSTNHCFKPLTKPVQTSSKPLCPLRGLHSLHLNKSKRGEYNQRFALQTHLLNIQIKGFPRNITKHTKRNMLRHSTNPCGKPSFSSSPLRGTVGVNTNLFRFPLPLEGGRGVNTIKSFRFAKGYLFPSLAYLYPSHSPKPEQTSAGAKINKG